MQTKLNLIMPGEKKNKQTLKGKILKFLPILLLSIMLYFLISSNSFDYYEGCLAENTSVTIRGIYSHMFLFWYALLIFLLGYYSRYYNDIEV